MENQTKDNNLTTTDIPGGQNSNEESKNKISHIYDRLFKRILTLSARAVISLINALFGTCYPPDSIITYNWTEHHDDQLHHTIADTILTINHQHSYHMEAQMYKDEEIEFRVFDYGYRHALKHKHDGCTLTFPEARIIFLYEYQNLPDTYTITLNFGTQGIFNYTVPTFKLLAFSPEEISQKKLIILIPFMLLKLRRKIEKKRTPESLSYGLCSKCKVLCKQ